MVELRYQALNPFPPCILGHLPSSLLGCLCPPPQPHLCLGSFALGWHKASVPAHTPLSQVLQGLRIFYSAQCWALRGRESYESHICCFLEDLFT